MKVLIASDYNHPNSVIKSYFDGTAPYCELAIGIPNFWNSTVKFEVIHIHWPEDLFYCEPFNEQDIKSLVTKLDFWKRKGTKFVITRHNSISNSTPELNKILADTCYKYADGVIHLGEYSFNEFLKGEKQVSQKNIIINHPNYFNIKNSIKRKEARKRFNISEDAIVFLSFGVIRNEQEQKDLTAAFKRIEVPQKKLILVNSLYLKKLVAFRHAPLKNLQYKKERASLKKNDILIDETRYIDDSIIQYYFNAADIIVVPRIAQLNSGVPYLAFSFSKIVIGPDITNIGELLRKTFNVTYQPGNIISYADAMVKSTELISTDTAEKNYLFAQNECNIFKIGKEQVMFYETLIKQNANAFSQVDM